MITNNINMILTISEAKGFGINTDLFETNILNLSVVIGVLIYYGRVALGNIIKDRKEIITKNLQEADSKFLEAEENLSFAKKNLEIAKTKADQIRQQGTMLSAQTSKSILDSIEDDIRRLKTVNLSSIKMEENKSISEVCQKLSQGALSKAVENLKKDLNPAIHKKIIKKKINKISVKSLKTR